MKTEIHPTQTNLVESALGMPALAIRQVVPTGVNVIGLQP
jgi:hypothetical protein